MKKLHVLTTALAAAAFLAGCGGDDAADQAPRVTFTQVVSFGDSLSDVGTYDVGIVAAAGGGHYSINGVGATGLPRINWTEFLADTLLVGQPCAAETGLDTLPIKPGYAPVAHAFHDTSTTGNCTNYAQGGARVTDPHGPGNTFYFNASVPSSYSNAIGQLTVPVKQQITNYLNDHGQTFNGNQLVTVFAGGNDIFINVATFQATVGAGGDPTAAATAAVTAMGTAGAELAAYVNQMVLAKGATHVVVVNLPDVSLTPFAIASGPSGQALVKQMTQAFNGQLQAGLTASSSLLFVDAFSASEDQAAHPAEYGLSNVTTPACDLTVVSSSLICTKPTLISALLPTPSTDPATAANGYEYADSVHPTPFGYSLLATLVAENLAIKGWL
jgi:outer membrane lipase/esterase